MKSVQRELPLKEIDVFQRGAAIPVFMRLMACVLNVIQGIKVIINI